MASWEEARLAGVVMIAMPQNAAVTAEESIAEGVVCVSWRASLWLLSSWTLRK